MIRYTAQEANGQYSEHTNTNMYAVTRIVAEEVGNEEMYELVKHAFETMNPGTKRIIPILNANKRPVDYCLTRSR